MSCLSGELLTSVKQCPTPLNTLFFSEFNQSLLNRGIREKFYKTNKIKIDYQDKDDLIALMRTIYVANYSDPYGDVNAQVKFMNGLVIDKAIKQISTGVSQYYGYIRDVNAPIMPPAVPVNPSTYGNKLDNNDKIGF